METRIRPAVPSDRDTLVDLARRTISASYRPFLGDAGVDAFLSSGAVELYIEEGIDRCDLIEADGATAGLVVVKDNLIDLLMIDVDRQGRGLGTQLLHHAEQRLFLSHAELQLESFEPNEQANAFYRKNGWTEAMRFYDDDSDESKIVFMKHASQPDGRQRPAS